MQCINCGFASADKFKGLKDENNRGYNTLTDEMKEWAVKVIDLNGQTLMYEQITTTDDTSIDINTLEEGTYLLRVVNKTNTNTPAPVKAVKVKN